MTNELIKIGTFKEYCDKYSCNDKDVLDKIIDDFKDILNYDKAPWIAGGFLRRLIQNVSITDGDVDLFFRGPYSLEYTILKLEKYITPESLKHSQLAQALETPHIKYQFINKWYDFTLEHVLNRFDYTICQFGTDLQDIYSFEGCVEDLNNRELKLNIKRQDDTFAYRFKKYMSEGFMPTGNAMQHWNCFALEQMFNVHDPRLGLIGLFSKKVSSEDMF